MKHRSVIGFVIVAAALFAAPQLSHDLRSFGSALGARLSGELMYAFLSLPATEGTTAAVAQLPSEARVASCTKERTAARTRKNDPARAAERAAERAGDELALMAEPLRVSEPWATALHEVLLDGAAALPHKSLGEVAMIIPPDSGIDPKGFVLAARAAASEGRAQSRKMAKDVRVSFVKTRLDGNGAEWRMTDEVLRRLEETLPGAQQFRFERDGAKSKVLKVRRTAPPCCAQPFPPAPRAAGVDEAAAPLPSAASALSAFVGE